MLLLAPGAVPLQRQIRFVVDQLRHRLRCSAKAMQVQLIHGDQIALGCDLKSDRTCLAIG
jgi:hypothetical protein